MQYISPKKLKDYTLFNDIREEDLTHIASIIKEVVFQPGEVIISEGDLSNEIYIIAAGEVRIVKKDPSTSLSHTITTLTQGDIIGEMAIMDPAPRSATVIAIKTTTLYCLDINDLSKLSYKSILSPYGTSSTKLYSTICSNIAKISITKTKNANTKVIETLSENLELAKSKLASSLLMINIVVLMSTYIIVIQLTNSYLNSSKVPTGYVSQTLALIFGIGVFFIIKSSGYPLEFFGITLKNWKKSVIESLMFTLIFLILICATKYFIENNILGFQVKLLPNSSKNLTFPSIILIPLMYVIFVPIQELVARGILQGILSKILVVRHNLIVPIVISNLLFAIVHMHISSILAIGVLIPGCFWGWLYSRHNTLIGVIISHLILGVGVLYIIR